MDPNNKERLTENSVSLIPQPPDDDDDPLSGESSRPGIARPPPALDTTVEQGFYVEVFISAFLSPPPKPIHSQFMLARLVLLWFDFVVRFVGLLCCLVLH
jgi:hypothetical protein